MGVGRGGRKRERKIKEVVHVLIERMSGSKTLNLMSFLIFSTKGSFGLLRESMFTPKDVLVITSMLYAPKMLSRKKKKTRKIKISTALLSLSNRCSKKSV